MACARPFLPLRFILLPMAAVLLLRCSGQTPEPVITSFTAAPAIVTVGQAAMLTPVFANGSGVVDGLGTVASGVPLGTGDLAVDTTFTLVVEGDGTRISRTVTVRAVAAPVQPGVTAPPAITAGGSATATAAPQAGCTFTWVITGGTLTGGADTGAVTFTAGGAGYVVLSCTATNAAGAQSAPSLTVCAVEPAPQAPVITAPAFIAADQSGCCASVPAQAGCSYAWTVTGGALTSSATGSSITFSAGDSGTVLLSCVMTDGFSISSAPGQASCAILTPPAAPVISTAATYNCGDTGSASVADQPGVAFAWTVSGGTFIGPGTGATVVFTVTAKSPLHLTCIGTNALGVTSATATHDSTVAFSNSDVLKALNFDTTVTPRKGASGQELTDADHPLGHSQSNIQRVPEIFMVNDQNAFTTLHTDLSYTCTAMPMPDATPLAAYKIKDVVKAHLLGDGTEQVVIAAFPGPGATNDHFDLYLVTGGAARTLTFVRTVPWPGSRDFDPNWTREWHQKISMAAGDLDGDGRDEVVIAADGQLLLFDHNLAPIALSATDQVIAPTQPLPVTRVECCDLDHTGHAAIIMVRGGLEPYNIALVDILKYQGNGVLTRSVSALPLTQAGYSLRSASVKAADLVGDGRVEIVFCGVRDTIGEARTMIMQVTVGKDGAWTPTFLPVGMEDDLNSTRWGVVWPDWMTERDYDACVPILALADLDGDGVMEIIANDSVLEFTAATGSAQPALTYAYSTASQNVLWADVVACWGPDPAFNPGTGLGFDNWEYRRKDTAQFDQMAVGRLTFASNANNEILIMDQNGDFLRRYYWDKTSNAILRGADIQLGAGSPYAFFCLADLGQDGTYVQYLGHTLAFTPPIVTAVLASPPYWGNLPYPQNIGNSDTEWGNSQGASGGVSASVGFSESTTVGAKLEVPVVSNGELEMKATDTCTWDFSFEIESGYEREVSYTTFAGTNGVLFTCVPIDVYAYKVISAGPDATYQAGEIITIKEPRAAQLQFTDVQFYNDHCGNAPQIDSSILPQTLGQPHTYPTLAQATALVNNTATLLNDPNQAFLLQNATAGLVPEGNLYNTITYSTSLSLGGSASFEYEHAFEVEASFILVVGGSLSLNCGLDIFAKTDTGQSITGIVGGLPPEEYLPGLLFNWGIYSYTTTVADGNAATPQTIKVINYWVQ